MKFLNGKTSLCISSQVGLQSSNAISVPQVRWDSKDSLMQMNHRSDLLLSTTRQTSRFCLFHGYYIINHICIYTYITLGMGEALQNPRVFDAISMLDRQRLIWHVSEKD